MRHSGLFVRCWDGVEFAFRWVPPGYHVACLAQGPSARDRALTAVITTALEIRGSGENVHGVVTPLVVPLTPCGEGEEYRE